MNERERAEAIYALAAGLVLADDDDDDAEDEFLAALASRLGVVPVPRVAALSPEEAAALAARIDPAARDEALATLLDAAAADATVRFEERGYLYAVGGAFGIDERAIDARITERITRR